MMTTRALLGILLAGAAATGLAQPSVVLENDFVRYAVSPDGRNLAFVDRATGVDYLKPGPATPCAFVSRAGQEFPATSAALADGRLSLKFAAAGVEAWLRVEPRPSYIRITVESIRGGEIDSFVFLNIPLSLRGRPDEPFGACAFSLNLKTRVDQLPALQTELKAACLKKFGLVGAKAAIVGMPMNRMLPSLKEVLSDADEMPPCQVAGPWAREVRVQPRLVSLQLRLARGDECPGMDRHGTKSWVHADRQSRRRRFLPLWRLRVKPFQVA